MRTLLLFMFICHAQFINGMKDRELHNQLVCSIIENNVIALVTSIPEGFPLNRDASKEHPLDPLLCIAARHGRHMILDTLFANYQAMVTVVDLRGNTPLHCAVRGQHIEAVRLLVNQNASLLHKNNIGLNPLHEAIETPKASCAIIKLLLDKGAPINEPDEDGNTIAHTAYALNRMDIVDLLDEYEVDWNAPNNEGLMPSQLRPIQRPPSISPPPVPAQERTYEHSFDWALGSFQIPDIFTYYHLIRLNIDDTAESNERNQKDTKASDSGKEFWARLFRDSEENGDSEEAPQSLEKNEVQKSTECSWDTEESASEDSAIFH